MARTKSTTTPAKTKMVLVVDVPRDPQRKIWSGPDRSTIGRKNIERMVKDMIASRYRPAIRREKAAH